MKRYRMPSPKHAEFAVTLASTSIAEASEGHIN
jgi:hypothetical protein